MPNQDLDSACVCVFLYIWVYLVPLCACGNRRQLRIILRNTCYLPPVREILSPPWSSQIRLDWLFSKFQQSPVTASLLLWFQVCATTPGIFMWVLGTWIQVLMFVSIQCTEWAIPKAPDPDFWNPPWIQRSRFLQKMSKFRARKTHD